MSLPPAARDVDKGWIIDQMIGAGHGELAETYTEERQLAAPSELRVVMEAHRADRARRVP